MDPETLCQWFTPPGVAEAFLAWCRIADEDVVLEPSAGEGALVPDRRDVLCFEIDPERVSELEHWRPHATVVCADFLSVPPPQSYAADVCIQNPPYAADGEGVYLRQGLLWAPRCCSLIRAGALQGLGRFNLCWRFVRPTRIAFLIHRPHFLGPLGGQTKHTPQYDYLTIECVSRETPLEYAEQMQDDKVEVSWVNWR